ncbi:MAG: hypothetical protein L5656_01355 [Thermanaeromonas sp.]|nr:hypothetical protein [Thermanaeromonas sp.]MCG0277168.1 hypothetical protein [Thermanaeromonas sp.]
MKILILVLYFTVMLAIGLASHRRSRDINGFFLGHRSIGPWISAFAYSTT